MNIQKIIPFAFILMVAIQLYVPASMIVQNEEVLKAGKVYKFKTAPIDPNDPFKGKYIDLLFDANRFYTDADAWSGKRGVEVFVHLVEDEEGFAQIQSLSTELPTTGTDFIKANIGYIRNKKGVEKDYVEIAYPFDRFYMEESKAYEAEQVYRESQSDTMIQTYTLVRVLEGEAVIENVMVDGVPIQEVVKQRLKAAED